MALLNSEKEALENFPRKTVGKICWIINNSASHYPIFWRWCADTV